MIENVLNFFNLTKYKQGQPETVRKAFAMSGKSYVSPDSSMKISAFYRGLIYISTQIAKLPFEIKDVNNNVLVNSNIATLIDLSPNPEMNSFFFKLFMTQSAIIHGNSYAEIERDVTGKVIGLWPMRSEDIEMVRDAKGSLWYRVIGGSISQVGSDAYLRPKDVYHIRNFHTKDGLSGQSLVAYASDVLGIAIGSDMFANSLYANAAMPSGVLRTDGTLSDAAFERLKEDWDKAHSGRKVGGTAILEEGVSFEALTLNPDVLQFLESRKFNVLEIARFLGLPPTKLYDSESAKFNNIEHNNLEVAVDTLDAWAKNYEQETDVKLLNKRHGGRKSQMDLYAVFRGDMKTRSEYFSKRMATGSITPNEIRIKEGDAPYEDGDRFYIATNNYTPSDRMDEVIDSQIKSSETKKEDNKDKELTESVKNFLDKRN